jgi:predicted GIY-YIG superfamily endonuclease
MYYVYLIESISAQGERYLGMTNDLKERLEDHNAGKSSHTSKFKPWKLTTYIAFTERAKAEAFERYLKSGQGTRSLVSDYGNSVLLTLIPLACDLMTSLALEFGEEFVRSASAPIPSTLEGVNEFRVLPPSRPT